LLQIQSQLNTWRELDQNPDLDRAMLLIRQEIHLI